MADTKHTPGRWEPQGSSVYVGHDCIALCDTDNDTQERYEANARLIAAAPDMLAALKFVHEHIADKERGPRDLYPAFGLNSGQAVEMVRAAIARAQA